MLDLGCKKERLHIVHNSLDTDLQSAIYDKCHASDIYRKHFTNDLPVVIYIGRVQIRKKVDQLIYACKELISNNNPVNLVIVGPNDDDESIGELVKSLNLESNVWFFGPSYDETVNAELLYNASVCVCPNGVGLSAIHSLSYGTPVVSNDDFAHQMPEFESIINEQTGSFFMSNSILDLSEHINKWVIKTDEERYKIRKMARKTILEEWSVQYQLSILKKVLG
jgi:glycosyltransferase involved in cell wall biosynthesis